MSFLEGDADFTWGKVATTGLHRYESFTYKGVEYFLYDCIYMLHVNCMETSIGKIVKMWETATGDKKLRVIWFFRPRNVINFLNFVPKWNELFLACGEGEGLKDTIEVGKVLGKCNVICTSDDKRNPSVSNTAAKEADYYFSHTFDVGTRTISKFFPDEIDKIRIEEFFRQSKNQNHVSNLPLKRKVRFDESGFTDSGTRVTDSRSGTQGKVAQKPKDGLYKRDNTEAVNLLNNKKAMTEKDGSQSTLRHPGDGRLLTSVVDQPLKTKVLNHSVHSDEEDMAMPARQRLKQGCANAFIDQPLKKRVLNPSVHSDEGDMAMPVQHQIKQGCANFSDPPSLQKEYKRDTPDVSATSTVNRELSLGTKRLRSINDVSRMDKAVRGGEKARNKVIEVTKKPIPDVKWFSEEPWEVRLQSAHEEGKLVFLTNLDPSCTSSEVEDIIWAAFDMKVDAKIIPLVANSSTIYGQAYVIFCKKEMATFVISELRRRHIMQAEGRPIIAFRKSPVKTSNSCGFPGHLVIGDPKLKRTDAQRNAVSTSHSAQDNTIEYDFAMEWRVLQERSDRQWKRLHQAQEDERKDVEKELKDAKEASERGD